MKYLMAAAMLAAFTLAAAASPVAADYSYHGHHYKYHFHGHYYNHHDHKNGHDHYY